MYAFLYFWRVYFYNGNKHYFNTTSNKQSQRLLIGWGTKVYTNDPGHMSKIPIF